MEDGKIKDSSMEDGKMNFHFAAHKYSSIV